MYSAIIVDMAISVWNFEDHFTVSPDNTKNIQLYYKR